MSSIFLPKFDRRLCFTIKTAISIVINRTWQQLGGERPTLNSLDAPGSRHADLLHHNISLQTVFSTTTCHPERSAESPEGNAEVTWALFPPNNIRKVIRAIGSWQILRCAQDDNVAGGAESPEGNTETTLPLSPPNNIGKVTTPPGHWA